MASPIVQQKHGIVSLGCTNTDFDGRLRVDGREPVSGKTYGTKHHHIGVLRIPENWRM